MFQPTNPHERSPYVPHFVDRSQEETNARAMARSVLKLKGKGKGTFSSLADSWCIPAPSLTNPENEEFVVDSRAFNHVLSRKD